jgi:hypothetical protein
MKGGEIEKLKKTMLDQNDEIRDKDQTIAKYKKLKTKMKNEIIWDEIINEFTKL